MIQNIKELSQRDKAILIGLFLSRFDKKALDAFGFTGFRQAYNVLGYSIGFTPKSIQNYRDEFDPYFPNPRNGWRNRKLRDYCKVLMDGTANLTFDEFYNIIKIFLSNEVIDETDIVKEHRQVSHGLMANRLITGKAAEEYFVMNYQTIDMFLNYEIVDTTQMGCGFDFKLIQNNHNYYVEVKGMNEKNGNILMTEKEHQVASELRDLYCLFVVRNFREKPEHQMYFNPVSNSAIQLAKIERPIIQISYKGAFL